MFKTFIRLFLLFCLTSSALEAQTTSYFPQHYFRNPLNIPIVLNGGFGEVRPNHFHTGIDIATEGRENLPVHAAADGYIARISISSRGYGNALYINHPNGYTTVYGHLNKFYPKLQKWMIKQQYQQQKWAIQLFPKVGQFPVKKGQIIAWSGTTGGSMGPHLHFEIRNTKSQHVLNELLFGLPYDDNRPPKVQGVAIYDGRRSIYLQQPKILALINKGGHQYRTHQSVVVSDAPKVFIGVHAEDYSNHTYHWMGIFNMRLYRDDILAAETLFRSLSFSHARYANAYGDYKTKKEKGVWYQGLYRLPNNKLKVYPYLNRDNGKIDLSDGQKHKIRIELYDVKGNKSVVQFTLQYQPNKNDNNETNCKTGQIWTCCQAHQYRGKDFKWIAPAGSFYDDICFNYSLSPQEGSISKAVQVMNADIPLEKPCTILLKVSAPLSPSLRSKIAFVHHVIPTRLPGNNPHSGLAAKYKNGWATASVTTLGNYYVVIDTIAPKIISFQKSNEVFKSGQVIRFKATDKITSVATFNGYINGKWIRFVRRGDTYTYRLDGHCPKGENRLIIKAVDENGNKAEKHFHFRYQLKKKLKKM